jgi:hypothetical protein
MPFGASQYLNEHLYDSLVETQTLYRKMYSAWDEISHAHTMTSTVKLIIEIIQGWSGPYLEGEGGQGAAAPQGKSHNNIFVHIFLGKAKYFITGLTEVPLWRG